MSTIYFESGYSIYSLGRAIRKSFANEHVLYIMRY